MTKIVFFGTPDFSVPFLSALIKDSEIKVTAVVCQPDKPAGRKGEITPPAVKSFAIENGVDVLQPTSLKKEDSIDLLKKLNADLFVVVAYGKIIPQEVLDIPTRGSINVHPSLLPEYRGPSPMQAAIAEGDDMTGITIMELDAGMDTGPILAQETISLDGDETYTSLQAKVHLHGPDLLIETLKRYAAGEITPIAQDNSRATLTSLLTRENGHVDWSSPMIQIERKVRAYNPWPGTWTMWNDKRIKILKAQPSDFNAELEPGTVQIKDDQIFIDCSNGTLEILELQIEGKAVMSSKEFLIGHKNIDGAVLT